MPACTNNTLAHDAGHGVASKPSPGVHAISRSHACESRRGAAQSAHRLAEDRCAGALTRTHTPATERSKETSEADLFSFKQKRSLRPRSPDCAPIARRARPRQRTCAAVLREPVRLLRGTTPGLAGVGSAARQNRRACGLQEPGYVIRDQLRVRLEHPEGCAKS